MLDVELEIVRVARDLDQGRYADPLSCRASRGPDNLLQDRLVLVDHEIQRRTIGHRGVVDSCGQAIDALDPRDPPMIREIEFPERIERLGRPGHFRRRASRDGLAGPVLVY